MKRRFVGLAAIVLGLLVVLAGCGKKDAGSIVSDMEKKAQQVESYAASGKMVLNTGTEPQEYQVEVWFKQKSYYRIALSNAKKDISQIVLRNDDGVFVLTPHLNKTFRFQSDWPENQGQVYLFQSLVKSITADPKHAFTKDGDSYVFATAANYSNALLKTQKIWFDKKTFAPQQVEISDGNGKVIVVMTFQNFEFGKNFDKDAFDVQRNMSGASLPTLPAMGQDDKDAGKAQASSDKKPTIGSPLSVVEPTYAPEGVEKPRVSEVKTGDNKGILLQYSGTYHYSLMETHPNEKPVSLMNGELVDLGFAWGILYGEEQKTMVWLYEGTEYRLSSGDLPKDEMIRVAMAVQNGSSK